MALLKGILTGNFARNHWELLLRSDIAVAITPGSLVYRTHLCYLQTGVGLFRTTLRIYRAWSV
jgi:hypothetical protein